VEPLVPKHRSGKGPIAMKGKLLLHDSYLSPPGNALTPSIFFPLSDHCCLFFTLCKRALGLRSILLTYLPDTLHAYMSNIKQENYKSKEQTGKYKIYFTDTETVLTEIRQATHACVEVIDLQFLPAI
jgi:hypothetical protein